MSWQHRYCACQIHRVGKENKNNGIHHRSMLTRVDSVYKCDPCVKRLKHDGDYN